MQFPQQTQFIKRDALADLSIILAWLFGVVAPLLISTFGNYIMFSGGWQGFTFPHFVVNSLVWAVVFQLLCVGAQLAFKSKAKKGGGMNWWIAYGIALLVSAVPSFLTAHYGFSEQLTLALAPQIGSAALPVVIVAIFLGALAIDMLPEWVAVE